MNELMNKLTLEWNKSGILEGDTVLIHSSLRRIIGKYKEQKFEINPTIILDSFLNAVGSTGTLVLPLFNFDFPNTRKFDIKNTPSQMGALTEQARLHPQSVRTGHPIYSFAIIGFNSNLFKELDNYSGYGYDSPFGILMNLNGKIAVLDLPDQNSMTFYHYIEEFHKVTYRYFKEFSGDYTNAKGQTHKKKYKLFVRNVEHGVMTHVNPAGELLWENKIYIGSKPGNGNGLRTAHARDIFDFVTKEIIQKNKAEGLLYRIEK